MFDAKSLEKENYLPNVTQLRSLPCRKWGLGLLILSVLFLVFGWLCVFAMKAQVDAPSPHPQTTGRRDLGQLAYRHVPKQ